MSRATSSTSCTSTATRAGKGQAYSYPGLAVLRDPRRDRGCCARARPTPWGSSRAGRVRPRAIRPAARASSRRSRSCHGNGTSSGCHRRIVAGAPGRRGCRGPSATSKATWSTSPRTSTVPPSPVGWDQPGFDDRQLGAGDGARAPPASAPWTHLVSVRTRIVEEPVPAVSLTTLASGAVVADFGKVYAAVPTVRFHHGVAGRLVTMRAGFLLDEPVAGQPFDGVPGQVSTAHGTQHTDMSYSYVQRGGERAVPPVRLPRVPLLPDRRPRRDARAGRRRGPGPPHGRARRARRPRSRRRTPTIDADLRARPPLRAVHRAGAVHRHAHPREGLRGCSTGSTSPRPPWRRSASRT